MRIKGYLSIEFFMMVFFFTAGVILLAVGGYRSIKNPGDGLGPFFTMLIGFALVYFPRLRILSLARQKQMRRERTSEQDIFRRIARHHRKYGEE